LAVSPLFHRGTPLRYRFAVPALALLAFNLFVTLPADHVGAAEAPAQQTAQQPALAIPKDMKTYIVALLHRGP
jgi:hypothetical protein